MKFSYLILAVLLLTGYQSYAQNTYPWPSTGNIGIGTSNATLGLLHLNGSTADLLSMSQTNPAQVIQFNAYNNVDFRIIQRSNAAMTLWTNTLERVRIDQTGNVGIGTTTPISLLDVNGNIAMAATAGLFFNSYWSGDWKYRANGYGNAMYQTSTGDFAFATMGNNIGGIGNPAIPNTRMTILNNGNVGIGTNTPREALSVNGNIRSKQVVVELANWPDYVFKKDYQLPSLEEVKAYIDQNQHLPEIPSEQEIAKNGLNLGEMNKLLMKKVEELTLYLIEKDQQLKAQEKVNRQMEERMQALEERLNTRQKTN